MRPRARAAGYRSHQAREAAQQIIHRKNAKCAQHSENPKHGEEAHLGSTRALADCQRCQPDQGRQPGVTARRLVEIVHPQASGQVGMPAPLAAVSIRKRRANQLGQAGPRQPPPSLRLALAVAPHRTLCKIRGQRKNLHGTQQQPKPDPGWTQISRRLERSRHDW